MLKKNLNFKIICVVTLTSLLLNKFEKSFTFIVTQMYDLVTNNLDINTFKTSFIKNNDKLALLNIILVNAYNLNIESKDFVI